MKSLATSNPHLRNAATRKDGVERNVRSSSAIEGVSSKVFRNAAMAQVVAANATAVKARRPK